MAAQSYQAGAARQRAERDAEAIRAELEHTRQTLRGLLLRRRKNTTTTKEDNNNSDSDDGPLTTLLDALAQAIVQEQQRQLQQQQFTAPHRGWFRSSRSSAAVAVVDDINDESVHPNGATTTILQQWHATLRPVLQDQLERIVGDAIRSPAERDQGRAQEAAALPYDDNNGNNNKWNGGAETVVEENDQGERVVKKRLYSI